jgi:hypothetical protein
VSKGILNFVATCIRSLIMPQYGYVGIVYAGADAASQRRLNMALEIFLLFRLFHRKYSILLQFISIGPCKTILSRDMMF